MPSPRSRPSRPKASWTAIIGVALLAGCASSQPPAAPVTPAPPAASDLLAPSTGYPLAVGGGVLRALDAAFEGLKRGEALAARREAEARLRADPGLHAAAVLLAECELWEGNAVAAVERLRPVVAELPGYDAAQVALGAAASKTGDLPTALIAYSAAAERGVPAAAARARELRPRALEITHHRLDDALSRGRHDEAREQLAFLTRWAPDERETLEATRDVARAVSDPRLELLAVRGLAAQPGAPREVRADLAKLEVETGDAAAGVRLYEQLLRESPKDPELAERLSWAKYRFRLQLLPAEVRGIAERPQLSRGDFAVLLYWIAPDVRYGRGGAVRIATDILETEHRDEIMRLLNLGLLDVDETLHKFYPDAAITRGDALAALLRLLAERGRVACVSGLSPRAIGREGACGLAAACGIESDAAGCLPGAPLSGAEAAELIQRSLELAPPR